MRDRKLLGEKPAQEKWFIQPEGERWEKHLALWPRGSEPQLEALLKKSRNEIPFHRRDERKKAAPEANLIHLQKMNSELSKSQATELIWRIESFLHKGENELFSFYVLNEYTLSEYEKTFGEFLDEHWNHLYDEMSSGVFHYGMFTGKVAAAIRQRESLFLLRPRSAQAVQDALHRLTRDDVFQLLKLQPKQLQVTPSTIATHIAALLEPVDEGPVPLAPLEEKIFMAFSRSVAKAGTEPRIPHRAAAEELLRHLEKYRKSFYEKVIDAKAGAVSTSFLSPLAETLLKHSEEFQPLEVLAIVFALRCPDSVVSGNRDSVIQLLGKLSTAAEDAQLNSLKLMAGFVLTWRGVLPNLKAWEELISDGTIELLFSSDMAVEVLKLNPRGGGGNLTKEVSEFRAFIRKG